MAIFQLLCYKCKGKPAAFSPKPESDHEKESPVANEQIGKAFVVTIQFAEWV